jgi:hypothetical protein
MDYKKMFDKLAEYVGKEKIGWIIVERRCPSSFGLPNAKHCGTYPQKCTDCWAIALGQENIEIKMDYKKMFDKLVKKLGREEIGRVIVGQICSGMFELTMVEDCGTYPQNCRRCWAGALGMERLGADVCID